jgi:para-aminobenzoate synthetase component 1
MKMIYNPQNLISNDKLRSQLNQLGNEKNPFLFIIDFEVKKFYLAPLNKLDTNIFFAIDGFSNVTSNECFKIEPRQPFYLKKKRLV